jgi:hypothetical protein
MRVDQTGSQQPVATVDVLRIGMQTLELVRRSDADDPFPHDENADTVTHLSVAHLATSTCSSRAGTGDDLRGVDEEKGHGKAIGRRSSDFRMQSLPHPQKPQTSELKSDSDL